MLIAEISRMYALVDGKIATMKVRETGAAEVERLEILLCPIIYGKCDQYGLKITAGNFCNDTHLWTISHLWKCITVIAVRSSGHAATWPCTFTDQENIKPNLNKHSPSLPLSLSLSLIAPLLSHAYI